MSKAHLATTFIWIPYEDACIESFGVARFGNNWFATHIWVVGQLGSVRLG